MCLLLIVASALAATEAGAADRPNIILILVDDLGYGELGFQGNAQIPTPHVDSLARHGVRMTDGYVTASYCSPSRAGLLTGRYQTRFGHELNPVGRHNLDPQAGLPLSERTLADELQDAGYATGLVGKWHLGATPEHHPCRRGFDDFFGFLHEGHFFVPGPPWRGVISFLRRKDLPPGAMAGRFREGDVTWSSHRGRDEPLYDENNPILRHRQEIHEEEYLTDALTREAVSFIERHKDRPFFLYLSYNAVHSPMQAPVGRVEAFGEIEDLHRRVFAAMLAELDDGIGQVLQKLSDEQLDDRTLIFFLSDNGGPTRELTSSNGILRGGKGDLYEGGIRVPFVVQWKGVIPAGRTYSHPVIALDVMATALAAAGIERTAGPVLDGINLLPCLTDPQTERPHRTLYWRMRKKAALRDGDWKLVRSPRRSAREASWELYNLKADIGESNNLAEARPEVLRRMIRQWEEFDRTMVPPAWTPDRRK